MAERRFSLIAFAVAIALLSSCGAPADRGATDLLGAGASGVATSVPVQLAGIPGEPGVDQLGNPGIETRLSSPSMVATKGDCCHLLMANTTQIWSLAADGIVNHYAGDAIGDLSAGDGGPASRATFERINDIAYVGMDVYVVDGNRLRRISDGIIETIVSEGGSEYISVFSPIAIASAPTDRQLVYILNDDPAQPLLAFEANSGLLLPVLGEGPGGTSLGRDSLEGLWSGIAVDYGPDGDQIYLADRSTDGGSIRRLDVSSGTIELVLGGGTGTSTNGCKAPSLDSSFDPVSVALDSSWGATKLAFSDFGRGSASCIYYFDLVNRRLTTIGGDGSRGEEGAAYGLPTGVAFVSDFEEMTIADGPHLAVADVLRSDVTALPLPSD